MKINSVTTSRRWGGAMDCLPHKRRFPSLTHELCCSLRLVSLEIWSHLSSVLLFIMRIFNWELHTSVSHFVLRVFFQSSASTSAQQGCDSLLSELTMNTSSGCEFEKWGLFHAISCKHDVARYCSIALYVRISTQIKLMLASPNYQKLFKLKKSLEKPAS